MTKKNTVTETRLRWRLSLLKKLVEAQRDLDILGLVMDDDTPQSA